jgi:NAD(P)-dependent dehydrogenase (short-subunit alcohol dehydrogenase family)
MPHDPVVLVTGAAGGLGPAVVRAFAERGARLGLTSRKVDDLAGVIEPLGLGDDHALIFPADLTKAADVAAWVEAVRAKWGRADVLVNVAGGYRSGKPMHEMDEADWDFMLDLNARSVFLVCRAVVPVMLAQGEGKIVNVGARGGLMGGRNSAAYAAAKSAVHRLTESLSAELREKNINVNAVLPSSLDTPANRSSMPKADPNKWVKPEDLAAVIVFLASDAARAIHGALIPVYGLS